MYCGNCGKELKNGSKFCGNCGSKSKNAADVVITNRYSRDNSVIICPKCGSSYTKVQLITTNNEPGCLAILGYLLLAITIVGIPIMIIILIAKGNKTKVNRYCVCQSCGYNFNMDDYIFEKIDL